MEPIVEPYNMFSQQKQAANSQAQGYGANPVVQTQPVATPTTQAKTSPLVSNTKPQNNFGQITNMDQLAQAMNYTTPEEEERLRKASVANQRIMAIGDALRHIGNIANTVNYAPSQQFNNPVQEEHQRYLQGKALRDAANRQYLAYQQAKAAQDAKQRQWEATFNYNAARDAAKMQAQQNQWEAQNKERARQFDQNYAFNQQKWKDTSDLNERKFKEQQATNKQRLGLGWANHNLSREKFNYLKSKGTNGGGGGSSSYDFATPNGTITMPKNFNQTQKDQVIAKFEKYIDRTEMQKQMRALGLNTQDPAQVRNFQFAKMLQEHQDVADYVSEKFKGKQTFASYPMARPEEKAPQPMFQTPWGGAAFAEENPYEQYLLSSEGDSDNDDYEQYLIQ